MRCEKCANETDHGSDYFFYYGRQMSQITWKTYKKRHILTESSIYGKSDSWICDSCVRKQRTTGGIKDIATGVLFVAPSACGAILLKDTLTWSWTWFLPVVFGLAGSLIIMWGLFELFTGLKEIGERMAIELNRNKLLKIRYCDAFFTETEYDQARASRLVRNQQV